MRNEVPIQIFSDITSMNDLSVNVLPTKRMRCGYMRPENALTLLGCLPRCLKGKK
jgi:hypothetical protein